MKNKYKFLYLVGTILLLNCAASMDLKLDSLKSDPEYGKIAPKITFEEFKYFTGEPERSYKEMAKLIVQETPTVIKARSAEEMINYMCKKAWENGADAVINVEIDSKNVAGGYARTSAIVKGTAVRFTD